MNRLCYGAIAAKHIHLTALLSLLSIRNLTDSEKGSGGQETMPEQTISMKATW